MMTIRLDALRDRYKPLHESHMVMALVSTDYFDSLGCMSELQMAQSRGIPVCPVLYPDVPYPPADANDLVNMKKLPTNAADCVAMNQVTPGVLDVEAAVASVDVWFHAHITLPEGLTEKK
mmetsp:Transcript_14152/g.30684  ORF Transcript_14152/g.30684 Transcript_14152/m.30684 type:complete len:120 (+) Transcript_14152:3-362(+)